MGEKEAAVRPRASYYGSTMFPGIQDVKYCHQEGPSTLSRLATLASLELSSTYHLNHLLFTATLGGEYISICIL